MLKIRYVSGSDSYPLGYYNPVADEIVIDSRLRKHPKLYQYVLRHEIQHQKIKKNVWRHFIHDLRQIYTHYSEPEIDNMITEFTKNEKVSSTLQAKIIIMNGILSFSSPFIMIVGMCKSLTSRRKRHGE